MTATITPERSGTPAGRDGFARLLHAEWTKFRTVRGWVLAALLAALLTAAIGMWAASGGQCGSLSRSGQAVSQACPAPPLGPGGEAVADSYYFVRQPLRGNGSITVRVTALTGGNSSDNPGGPFTAGLQPWAKAGIIISGSLRQGSAYAAMMVTGGHGARLQYDYTHDTAGLPGAVSAASPRWLRLTRTGDTITGYDSANGTRWSRVGTARLAGLPSAVQAGLFVTSPYAVTAENGSPTLATAVFDQVAAPSRSGWSGADIGVNAAYQSLRGGFHQAGGGFTVSGSGDIAPAVVNSMSSGKPADHGLIGGFAGLIVVIVLGTVFITAEYRRGLIRTTFAASPRRGRVLAAKAIVIGSVTFAAGLVGAAVTVPLGERLMRDNGRYVFPISGLTELRVVAGTAALLALAAVLALAVAAMARRSAGPVAAVIALIVLPYFFASPLPVLPAGVADWLLRVTPAAAFAIQQTMPQYPQVSSAYTPQYGYYPLSPWAGLAVLCAWTAVALGLAAVLLRRRDA